MTDREPGFGEAKEEARKRRLMRLIGVSAVVGAAAGVAMALGEQGEGNLFAGDVANLSLPPLLALGLGVTLFAALIVLPLWSLRFVDELEMRINVNALALAGAAMVGAWPVWQILALGELLPPPTGYGLFLLGVVVMFGAYAFFKIRS